MTRPLTIEALAGMAMCSPDSARHAGCRTIDEEVAWFAHRVRHYDCELDGDAIRAALLDRDKRMKRADATTGHARRLYR